MGMSLSEKLFVAGLVVVLAGPLVFMIIRRLVRGETFDHHGPGIDTPPSGVDAGGPPLDGGGSPGGH